MESKKKVETNFLRWYVHVTALLHFYDSSILLSCVAFLELCGIDTNLLKVDVEACARIFQHKYADFSNFNRANFSTIISSEAYKDALLMFLQLLNNQSNVVTPVLQMLEEATRAMPWSNISISKVPLKKKNDN